MSLGVHGKLFRAWRYLIATGYLLMVLLAVRSTTFGGAGQGTGALMTCGFFLPLALGFVLASALHEPMHRPFAMLLPGARPAFLRSHAVFVLGAALFIGYLGNVADRTLAYPAMVGVALCNLSLPLLLEPGLRLAGSRWLTVLVGAVELFFVRNLAPTRLFIAAHPALVVAGALAVTVLCFAIAFSVDRWRRRALVPYTPMLNAGTSVEYGDVRRRERQAREGTSRVRWRHSAADGALNTWVRAVTYSRSAGWRGGALSLGFVGAGAIVLLSAVTNRQGASLIEPIYRAVVAPESNFRGLFTGFPYFLALFVLAQGCPAPKMDWLYPISRERRAHIAFAASAWRVATSFAFLTGIVIILAWVHARNHGFELPAQKVAEFILLQAFIVPLLPAGLWGLLFAEVRKEALASVLIGILVLVASGAWQVLVQRNAGSLYSPGAVAVCLALIAGSQWVYRAALLRFYRRGDLLQERGGPVAIGLV